MIDERLEFEIAQLADGALAAERIAAVRAEIARNPDAAESFASFEKLNAGLAAMPSLPAMNWNRLGEVISNHVGDTAHVEPVSYPMPWLKRTMQIAIAACVLLAAGVAIRTATSHSSSTVATPPGMMSVAGPAIEAPAGEVIRQITIGPSEAVASAASDVQYGDAGVVVQPQRVVIASAADAVQDNQDSTATPY